MTSGNPMAGAAHETVQDMDKIMTEANASMPVKHEGAASAIDLVEVDEDSVSLTFPQRLMETLENEAHASIISWLPEGKAFMVFDKKAFEKEILPKYFNKQSKFASFTRKLNRWAFTRVTRGPDAGAWFHPCFQRGNYRLLMRMGCKTIPPDVQTLKHIAPDLSKISLQGALVHHQLELQRRRALEQEALLRLLQPAPALGLLGLGPLNANRLLLSGKVGFPYDRPLGLSGF